FTGCALSGLHSLRSSFYWLRPVGLAFAPLILLLAAPCRACIRSAHPFTGCALSGLHSLRSSFYWLRPVGLAFAPLILLLAAPCRACIRSAHPHLNWCAADDFQNERRETVVVCSRLTHRFANCGRVVVLDSTA